MSRSLSAWLIKGIEYASLPFQYRRHFWPLLTKLLTDRRLLHELPRLTPHRRWLQAMGIRTVIDVGAYIGSFAYAMRLILPQAQIYSFEPLETNYRTLMDNLAPLDRFRAFQTALGEKTGAIDFYQDDFSASSSALEMADLHRRAFPQTGRQVKVTVPLARLDDYLDQIDLQPPVLLKLDVQGYEAAVLRGAAKTLAQADYLLCELSFAELYAGQPLFDDLYALLAASGFRFAGSFDILLSPLDGSILQADGLFIRRKNA
ncbi:MAG: FkbM family methyltransferase [Anaerolineales bacterium]